MRRSNTGILPIYSSRNDKLKNRWYSYGQTYPFICGLAQVPPINFSRTTNVGGDILEFKIRHIQSGTEYEVTEDIKFVGLQVVSIPGKSYDIVWYPSVLRVPNINLTEGLYDCEFFDGVNRYYSEEFLMKTDLSNLIKIEFCHSENIEFTNGALYYPGTNNNYIYLSTDIGKPSYQYVDEVDERDGVEYVLKTVSFKQHKFDVVGSESLIDVLRLIRAHDFVTIYYQGETYSVDSFLMNDPEWLPQGDLANVGIEFRTDTVVVVSGRGVTDVDDCGGASGSCLTIDHNAVTQLTFGSTPYLFGYYTNSAGVRTDLEHGDIVMIKQADDLIYPYSVDTSGVSVSYSAIVNAVGQKAFRSDTGGYYESKNDSSTGDALGFVPLRIDDYTVGDTWTVTGQSFSDTVVEVWLIMSDESERLVSIGTDEELSEGLSFTPLADMAGIKLKAGNLACGIFNETDWYYFDGIGFWYIEEDFVVGGTNDGDEIFNPLSPL